MRKARLPSLSLAILLGLTSLGAPAAQAAPTPPGRPWGILVKGLAAAFGWLEIRCSPDLDGHCRPSSPAADQLDGGCSIDPQGGCRPSSLPADQLNIGCSIDPQGGCQTGTGN